MKGKISAAEPVCVIIDEGKSCGTIRSAAQCAGSVCAIAEKFLGDGSMTDVVGRDGLRAREQTLDLS
jgi:hypothetical protein